MKLQNTKIKIGYEQAIKVLGSSTSVFLTNKFYRRRRHILRSQEEGWDLSDSADDRHENFGHM